MSDPTPHAISQAAPPHAASPPAPPAHAELHHAPQGAGDAAHAPEQWPDHYLMPHELPNLATLIEFATVHSDATPHHGLRPHPSQAWFINPAFVILYAILIILITRRALRHVSIERPGKLQNAVEAVMGGIYRFFHSVMGDQGKKYIPYVATLWLFILFNNLMGIVPGFKAPTSSFKVTVALGICTFCYVQFNAIRAGGFGGWFYHLMGQPKDAVTWALVPLFLFLEIVGELVKPVSLSLRLFGNIFGEDKLLASFLGMGMMITAVIFHTAHPWVGVPLHMPFYFLALLSSTIQATVFSLLSAIYIMLLLPHEEHGHDSHPQGGAAPATH